LHHEYGSSILKYLCSTEWEFAIKMLQDWN